MNNESILEVLVKWLSIAGLLVIGAFLCFGWLRGMEREMRIKRKHR